jgi:hypothetical protein
MRKRWCARVFPAKALRDPLWNGSLRRSSHDHIPCSIESSRSARTGRIPDRNTLFPPRRTAPRAVGCWLFTVLAVAACVDPEDGPDRPELEVELVRTFGQPAPDHPRAADLGADPASGPSSAVSASIDGLAIGWTPDERLYVADGLNRQFLAFEPQGRLAWTRERPEGDGPGETLLLTAVVVSLENRILVLDRRQGRTLEFDGARPDARTISLDFGGGLWGLEVDSLGELWALTWGGRRARASGVRLGPDGSSGTGCS